MKLKLLVRSALLPLIVTIALVVPTSGPETITRMQDAKAACVTRSEADRARVANLEKTATRVERRVVSKGKLVDRYYLPMASANQKTNKDGTVSFDLAVFHDDGKAVATSPEWYNPDNGRYYHYFIFTYVEHEYSVPCDGPDIWQFGFDAHCRRRYGIRLAPNYCNWNLYAGLQVGPGGTGWVAPWGYKRYNQQLSPSCADTGGGHVLTDGTWVRTWARVQVRFFTDTGLPLHLSQPRKTASEEVMSIGGTHSFSEHECLGKFCPSPDPPDDWDGYYAC